MTISSPVSRHCPFMFYKIICISILTTEIAVVSMLNHKYYSAYLPHSFWDRHDVVLLCNWLVPINPYHSVYINYHNSILMEHAFITVHLCRGAIYFILFTPRAMPMKSPPLMRTDHSNRAVEHAYPTHWVGQGTPVVEETDDSSPWSLG